MMLRVSPLAALNEALRASRAEGQPFAVAWPAASLAATAGLGEPEAGPRPRVRAPRSLPSGERALLLGGLPARGETAEPPLAI